MAERDELFERLFPASKSPARPKSRERIVEDVRALAERVQHALTFAQMALAYIEAGRPQVADAMYRAACALAEDAEDAERLCIEARRSQSL